MTMKNPSDTIGNRTLPASSTMPQLTAPPRASYVRRSWRMVKTVGRNHRSSDDESSLEIRRYHVYRPAEYPLCIYTADTMYIGLQNIHYVFILQIPCISACRISIMYYTADTVYIGLQNIHYVFILQIPCISACRICIMYYTADTLQ